MDHIVSRGHTRPLTEINFYVDSPEHTILFSSAHDKSPQLRNGDNGDWIGSYHGHKGAVWSGKLDPISGTLLATASGDFSSKLWCATTGKEMANFTHAHVVRTIDFQPHTSTLFATGCQDGLLRIYSTIHYDLSPTTYRICEKGNSAYCTKLVWLDNNMMLIGSKNGCIELYDQRSSISTNIKLKLNEQNEPIMDMEIYQNNNEDILITCGNQVMNIKLNGFMIDKLFTMPDGTTFKDEGGASRHPIHGNRFVAGGNDLWVREFDFNTGEELKVMKGHHGPIRCVRYHPNGNLVASGSEDATIRLWDVKTEADNIIKNNESIA